MRIYNVEPSEALWQIVSPLAEEIPIFKEGFDGDQDSVPDSYLLIRADISNSGEIYGDGEALLRQSDCDVILVSKGVADTSDCLHNRNRTRVEKLLKAEGASYRGYNLGYSGAIKSTEYTWNVTVIYGEKAE